MRKPQGEKTIADHSCEALTGYREGRDPLFLNSGKSTADGRGATPSSSAAANDGITTFGDDQIR